ETGIQDYAGGFSELGNLVADGEGRLLVTDRGANLVYALAGAEGKPVKKAVVAGNGATGPVADGKPALETPLDGVRAVWPHDRGFFVGMHEGDQVAYVDSVGIVHLFLDGAQDAHAGDGAPFDAPGKKVSEIRSVTSDAVGNLIVVESDVGFVRLVRRK